MNIISDLVGVTYIESWTFWAIRSIGFKTMRRYTFSTWQNTYIYYFLLVEADRWLFKNKLSERDDATPTSVQMCTLCQFSTVILVTCSRVCRVCLSLILGVWELKTQWLNLAHHFLSIFQHTSVHVIRADSRCPENPGFHHILGDQIPPSKPWLMQTPR